MSNPRPDLIFPNLALPKRYKTKGGSRRIIGIQAGATVTITDDASAGGRTAGWTETLDLDSYSYGAVLSLLNETGAQRTLSDVVVMGRPVEMLQGTEGILHDSFIDHDSIYENGEKRVEWGNDWIVTQDQTNKVADYLWKDFKGGKHTYMISLPGTQFNYEPGDWYRLQIGGAGQIEYIDSVCQIFQVETYRRAGDLGSTNLMLREVEEAWKNDSSAVARFIASGMTYQLPAQIGGIKIGSQYTTDKCDIYCDGTADEVEINQAISNVAANNNGGYVFLSRGTFVTAAAIELKANVTLMGEGDGTIIEKNANDYAVECVGVSGTEIEGGGLRDVLLTRNAADTNIKELLRLVFADDFTLANVLLKNPYTIGSQIIACDRIAVNNLRVTELGSYAAGDNTGVLVSGGGGGIINGIQVDGGSTARTGDLYGVNLLTRHAISDIDVRNLNSSGDVFGIIISDQGDGSAYKASASNISVSNCDRTAAGAIYGVLISTTNLCRISGVSVDDIDNTNTAANSKGLYISGIGGGAFEQSDDNDIEGIVVTGCSGTGIEITTSCDRNILSGRSTGNGTNLTDNGTVTNKAAFDAT